MAVLRQTSGTALPGRGAVSRLIAPYGFIGLALIAVAWPLSWSGLRPWSDWTFAPLWFGYIVTVDALVYARRGRSLLHSGAWRFLRLLAVSAVFWWTFEAFNLRTQNWIYLQPEPVGPLRFWLEASLDFSTVLPAIFETAALINLLLPQRLLGRRDGTGGLSTRAAALWFGFGLLCLALPLWNPSWFFGLIWACMFFLIDPVNGRLGRPSLLAAVHHGRWRTVAVLALAGLVCGFFWEMWNSLAMPKWIYAVPHIPQQRLFEMPLLGFSGYIPFAWECFAVYVFFQALWGARADVIDGSLTGENRGAH